ncbi:MAG: sodium:proton antiporter [Proteobacteria bacterium]|nr:MAG: sodium:proton antiporter [Pseudomonadota bacterium]
MTFFQILAVVLTATAFFAYLNYRFLRLPMVIGVMVLALATSLIVIGLDGFGLSLADGAARLIAEIDFDDTLLHAMLGPLLFAGALFVNLDDLLAQKWTILLFATVGVALSILLVGLMLFHLAGALGLDIPWTWCLVFGALISPTDPIAVLGILRKLGVSKRLETKFTGESLFNDGVGVVAFLILLEIVAGGDAGAIHVASLFVVEVGGGVALGLVLGLAVYWLLKRVDNYQVEILLSLALITGGYAVSEMLHLSAPIFAVVSGLLIGNVGRRYAMSEHSREHLDTFWELVDETLNALLFVLIGVEVLVLNYPTGALPLGVSAIVVVLLARFVGIGFLVGLLRARRRFSPHSVTILTWGGLRGGISVALALSLPPNPWRDYLVTITYIVVSFSIIAQGLTIGPLIARANADSSNPTSD